MEFAEIAKEALENSNDERSGRWMAVAASFYAESSLISVYSNLELAKKSATMAARCLKKAKNNADKRTGSTLLSLWRGLERSERGAWPEAQKILDELEEQARRNGGSNGKRFPETLEGRALMRLRAIIALKAWGVDVALERLASDYARYGKKRLEGYIKTWPNIGDPLPESFPVDLMPALLKARGG